MSKNILQFLALVLVTVASYFLAIKLMSPKSAPDANPTTVKLTITRAEQLPKLIPGAVISDYKSWAAFDPVTPSLINIIYNRYAYHLASSKPLGNLINAAIRRKLYPNIPTAVIFRYLKSARYDSNGQLPNSTLPYLNFTLFGYGQPPFNSSRDNRALHVAKILIKRGANVNAIDANSGRSPLHEAVLMNQHEVVKFLLKHKADPMLKVKRPKSKFHGMNALEFALFMQKAAQGENYGDIISTLISYMSKN